MPVGEFRNVLLKWSERIDNGVKGDRIAGLNRNNGAWHREE